jgi:hypothetical protein
MIAAMSVGLTSCSKDDEKDKVLDSSVIMNTLWINMYTDDGHYDRRYGFEFKKDGTYTYNTPGVSINGNYRIVASEKSKGVISYVYNNNEWEVEYDGFLYKMQVSGSYDFEQLWVYYLDYDRIVVHLYSNHDVQKFRYIRYKD